MIRSTLIKNLIQQMEPTSVQAVKEGTDIIFDQLIHFLVNKKRIEIRGFGSFKVNYCHPCIVRNPKTGEKVVRPLKAYPRFKMGRGLFKMINLNG